MMYFNMVIFFYFQLCVIFLYYRLFVIDYMFLTVDNAFCMDPYIHLKYSVCGMYINNSCIELKRSLLQLIV